MENENTELSLDEVKTRFERRKKRFAEIDHLQIGELQIYPPALLLSPDSILPDPHPLIDKKTPVGSMGSCFAREIKDYLETNGFNYIARGDGKHGQHGSANWDRVYNTGCMLQEVQRAFGEFNPEYIDLPGGGVVDPFRKGTEFQSKAEATIEAEHYITTARSVFSDSRVFIFTLGLSEVWYDKNTGHIFAETPSLESHDKKRHAFRLLSPDENVENVSKAVELLKANNPKLDIILTVSPVPLRATFFKRSALVSNNVSKATLIYTAHVIDQKYSYVHYFPSYEITFHLIDEPFDWDYRHVKRGAVAKIMQMFERVFLKK